MRRINQGVVWAVFLLLAGVFLLLKNLQVIQPRVGEIAWAGLFTVAGLVFLIAFLANVSHWWRAIPAFTLLGLGVPLALYQWLKIDVGSWQGPAVLFGVALGFWAVLLVSRDNWWAEIPAGVLTLLGFMTGFQDRLREPVQWLVAFTMGLGLVFALLYGLRARERRGWWPAIPASALILFGLVTWIGPLGPSQAVARWWPVALLFVGVLVLVASLQRLSPGIPGPRAPEKYGRIESMPELDAVPAAKGSSVTEAVPEVELPASRPPEPAAEEPAPPSVSSGEVDIYELLRQQPDETPRPDQ